MCKIRDESVAWEAAQKSIHDDLYYISASRICCTVDKTDGCKLEFRKCPQIKARRVFIVIASLVFLDVTASILLVRDHLLSMYIAE